MSSADPKRAFTEALVEQGYWIATGVDGLFGRTHRFESLALAFDGMIERIADDDGADRVYFPPVIARSVLLKSEYMQSFPDLCGCVHSYGGGEDGHERLLEAIGRGDDWGDQLQQTDMALTPAACYPLYPTLRGTLAPGGRLTSLSSFIFRHEPSMDPARLQMFRQRENIRVGNPEEVAAWRETWMNRGMALLTDLGLPVTLEVANDPFFGRGGRMLRANQRNDRGKFEICLPIVDDRPTALASFNYHQDKFGKTFDIRTHDGDCAHSACFGFGLERVVLGLLHTHGLDTAAWPQGVRDQLQI